ncbi:MAG: glycosyltransferase family 2 protein [Candidatus Aceula meridiana]|nr:glycosyltransferase family 2 protein [Candidatus Aceula meridiana]
MVSIIIPTFNEQDNLGIFYQRLKAVADNIRQREFEFIFVDDGSVDDTPNILQNLHSKDNRVKIIRFARNCGGHAALSAGLHFCAGDCAITLACDLQDPPELINPLLDQWATGSKVVWAVRSKREGESLSVRIFSKIYYGLINRFTNIKMPRLGADVFLADRVVLEAFKKMPEKHSSAYMAIAWLGFPQGSIDYVKESRQHGQSKWTLAKKIKLVIDSLLSFSDVFIRAMSIFGFLMALAGFVYALCIVFRYFFFGIPGQGWPSLIVAIFVLGGIQMMMLGLLGEYIWRTFDESRKRPQFVVEYTKGIDATST